MKRILIIGNCGAGKSHLAQQLGSKLHIPVVHLDTIYWLPGWKRRNKEDWQALLEAELRKDTWIIDGNYKGTMEKRITYADTIIYLHFSRFFCLTRVFHRRFRYHKQQRPDMVAGQQERISWELFWWILRYPRNQVRDFLDRYKNQKTVLVFSDPDELEKWVDSL
jgi:adenylate kinase family enzyme